MYKTQNRELSSIDQKFFFNFYQELPTYTKHWGQTSKYYSQSCPVGWCMYCVTLRLHDIKNFTSVSLKYTMEVHLADACLYFTFLTKVLPPPFHYSLGRYLYLFFAIHFTKSKLKSKISSRYLSYQKKYVIPSSREYSQREVKLFLSAGLFRSNTNFIIAIAQITKIIKLSDLYLYDIQTGYI